MLHRLCGCECSRNHRTQVARFFIVPQAMDIALHNGFCRYTKEMVGKAIGDVTKMSYEQLENAIFDEIQYLMRMANERINIELIAERIFFRMCSVPA